ncbi:DUF5659 domain-containing protein [Proteiniborus sp. MB09-C3]|uniref:DUF5659 domain-containing protein n=1 Tax=Proteiniborus sp. MB09-C3 TaxID=3050072 RepID=UPI002557B53C|nr:DUF5659 domain-containing protein [Proteiniborus sp. MB09-C3]WIV10529.1 DUF5659 domain-containing protein [Proteiniborus sp. MB09-C3]
MDQRKIYSLNLAAHALAKGYSYTIHKDTEKEGLKYFVFDDDITDIIDEYRQDEALQKFIRCYKKVKEDVHS